MKGKGQISHSISKTKQDRKNRQEASVENLRHKVSQTIGTEFRKTKMKTEGSLSKSKNNTDKNKSAKMKSKQKVLKPRIKGSYDITHLHSKDKNVSYTNTDRRRSSLKMHNKTQMNYDDLEDVETRVSEIRTMLSQLPSPTCNIKQLKKYYNSILQIIGDTEDPLHSMLMIMHSLYTAPMEEMFDLVLPYESLLLRRSELSTQIQSQISKNKHLFQEISLEKDEKEIARLEAIIQVQRREIQQRKESTSEYEKFRDITVETQIKKKDFKIDLGILKDNKPQGYHDEFLSHLPEMSESWRNQALREQRY